MIYVFLGLILLFSIMIHEVSHGYAAYALGDPTPKYMKRLNFNPLNHLDPIGSVIVPGILIIFKVITGSGFIIGWAKPVVFNPNNLRDKRFGELKVALAGPLSNLLVALFFGLILRFDLLGFSLILSLLLLTIVRINLLLAVFNLMPIPPLDGFHILGSFIAPERRMTLLKYSPFLLIIFIFFLFPLVSSAVEFLLTLITGY